MKANRNTKVLAALCTYLLLSTLAVACYGILHGAGAGQVGEDMYGTGWLKAFTNLSNLYLGFCSGCVLVCLSRHSLPGYVKVLFFTAACATGLTFLVVLVFLGPTCALHGGSYFAMYREEMLFFHLLNPLLGAYAVRLLPKSGGFTRKHRLLGVLPTVFYSALYIYHVVLVRDWRDFYGFTFGGKYSLTPIVALVLYSATYAIAAHIARISSKTNHK